MQLSKYDFKIKIIFTTVSFLTKYHVLIINNYAMLYRGANSKKYSRTILVFLRITVEKWRKTV